MRLRPGSRRRGRRERGVALLMVVVAIAVLTTLGVELAYNMQVDLRLAANERDSLRAHYMARSGIGLSRLVLSFQQQMGEIPGLGQLASGLGALLGGGAEGAAPPVAPASQPSLQLWKLIRVDCHLLRGMVASPGEEGLGGAPAPSPGFGFDDDEAQAAEGPRSFGGFEGCFEVEISDEEQRINLNKLDGLPSSTGPVVQQLAELLGDPRYAFLWEGEDAWGQRHRPMDVLIALRDWIDADETRASLNLGQGTEVFLPGFADEDSQYDRYEPRYEPKNAGFDSVEELHLVHGVDDSFMAAFGDLFTVFPDINRRLNINSDDPRLLWMAVRSVAADPADPRLQDELFMEQLLADIQLTRMVGFLGSSVQDFIRVVEASGIPVNPLVKQNPAGNTLVGDSSETYRLVSTGQAGDVQRRITTVVRMGGGGLGRLVYWREE